MSETRRRKSRQRERIFQLLTATDAHPTATWLYDQLRSEFPSVSLGNVYRNLAILEEERRIRRLSFGSTFDRYEASGPDHAHFLCEQCGRIYDLPSPLSDQVVADVINGHHHLPQHVRLEIRGVCERCR